MLERPIAAHPRSRVLPVFIAPIQFASPFKEAEFWKLNHFKVHRRVTGQETQGLRCRGLGKSVPGKLAL
jgi:hypothetical protein